MRVCLLTDRMKNTVAARGARMWSLHNYLASENLVLPLRYQD